MTTAQKIGNVARKRRGKPNVVHFYRRVTDAERAVLLAAGDGDPVQGWHNMLDLVRRFYLGGWRAGMPVRSIRIDLTGAGRAE